MSHPPATTPVPSPAALFNMTLTPAAVARPAQTSFAGGDDTANTDAGTGAERGRGSDKHPTPNFKLPKLRIEIRDLSHPGAKHFLDAVNAAECLATAAQNVLALLYSSPDCPTTTLPPTRSITLILRDMSGVAYTTGSDLDSDHKEVHFSLSYIDRINPPSRRTEEVTGVITHEFVHCFQRNGFGTCPGGLIEGIADWVRLNCRLSPPHWKRSADGNWDGGYQHTAYFLDYLERRFGEGTIRRMNEKLRTQRYEEKAFWTELVGRPVEQLWTDYAEKLKDKDADL
ncbi:peptidase of plants and bacteria-domain-containing protein [Dactylonectria macrodidyma]|uniref:Peptidase of plants and bacteria-domain-containing protein n=1 Tax=Dactylonectria macrodidyma TaxID=307937 RepID=A0A9P9FH72_9HYPO|nr:peptidase of plants and bacteria-domain-containing protein [Dactylonectria macrodidyma]